MFEIVIHIIIPRIISANNEFNSIMTKIFFDRYSAWMVEAQTGAVIIIGSVACRNAILCE
jgi:hypothetical protein